MNWALDAAFDLFEAYKLGTSLKGTMAGLDRIVSERRGSTVGALLFIRGEKTHRAQRVDALSGSSYDFAKLTDWVYAGAPFVHARFEQRVAWWEAHVRRRPLWGPPNEGWSWFLTDLRAVNRSQGEQDLAGWVEGVHSGYPSSAWTDSN